jgi:4'-phosphopantetheinyl transferase
MPENTSTSLLWADRPGGLTLPVDRVDVWLVQLDEPQIAGLESDPTILSEDEVARAARFHFEKDRLRFSRCRATLRVILGRYLRVPPATVHFSYSASGKPELAPDQNPQQLRFNVSHSAQMALIAVSVRWRLGVDIERVREDVNVRELSERYFSERERHSLRSLPESMLVQAFFACWTRKEAFLKATGDGLGFPLSDFSVSVHPEIDPRIEEIQGDASAASRWTVTDVRAADGFRSAVAVEGASQGCQPAD